LLAYKSEYVSHYSYLSSGARADREEAVSTTIDEMDRRRWFLSSGARRPRLPNGERDWGQLGFMSLRTWNLFGCGRQRLHVAILRPNWCGACQQDDCGIGRGAPPVRHHGRRM